MNWRVLKAFIRKELKQTLRDNRMRVLLFVVPVIQMSLFGLALHNEVRNIRLAVYAEPSDSLTWDLARRAQGSGWFDLVAPPSTDPFKAMMSGDVDVALVAPPGGLSKAVGRGAGTAQLLIDGTNTVRSQGVVNYFEQIRRAVQADKVTAGLPEAPRLKVSTRVLYNPTLESKYFMVPGVLAMLVIMVTLTLTSSSITREKERGTFETLLAAPISPATILLGKSVPFVILGLMDLPLLVGVAYFLFGVPMRGELWQLLVASIAFIGCTVSMGVLLSTTASNQQQSMLGGFLAIYPAQMLSGIIYPLENMPKWLYWVTYFNPLRYFAVLIRNILLKGGSPELFWPNVGALCLLSTFLIGLAWRRFSPTLN